MERLTITVTRDAATRLLELINKELDNTLELEPNLIEAQVELEKALNA